MSIKYVDYMLKDAVSASAQMGNKISIQICLMTLLSFFVEKRGLTDQESKQSTYKSYHIREVKRTLQKNMKLAMSCPD